jgi:hypothetical protein
VCKSPCFGGSDWRIGKGGAAGTGNREETMRAWMRLIAMGMVTAAAAGCDAGGGAGDGAKSDGAPADAAAADTASADAASADPVSAESPDSARFVGPGPVPEYARTRLDSAAVDVDGDGTEERVELYAEVELDRAGRPMWDDGQRWALVVRRGQATYPVFAGFVQLGTLQFAAVERAEGDAAALLVLTNAGAGFSVEKLVWDPARGGFASRGTLDAGGIVKHRFSPTSPY